MIIDNDYNDFDDDEEDVYDDGQYWQKWRLVPQIMQQNWQRPWTLFIEQCNGFVNKQCSLCIHIEEEEYEEES